MTYEQFEKWFGSDHINNQDLIALILELGTGQYPVEQFRKDVTA